MDSHNPYAAPQSDLAPVILTEERTGDPEFVRKLYLRHEAAVRSIGWLYYFGGFLSAVGAITAWTAAVLSGEQIPLMVILGAVYAVLGGLGIWAGAGLRQLAPTARVPATILACLLLLSLSLGTFVGAYFLYLLFCRSGKVVFSARYREVIRQTPHIESKTTTLVAVLLSLSIVILFLVVAFILIDYFGK